MDSLEFAKNWYGNETGDSEIHEMRIRGLAKMIDKFFVSRKNVTSYFVEGVCAVCDGDVDGPFYCNEHS